MKTHRFKKSTVNRLSRLERKCDRILSELLVIKSRLRDPGDGIDKAIDQMHAAALRMREQSERECRIVRDLFNSKIGGD